MLTELELAVTNGDAEAVKVLLQAGTNVPTEILVLATKISCTEIVKILLEHEDKISGVAQKMQYDLSEAIAMFILAFKKDDDTLMQILLNGEYNKTLKLIKAYNISAATHEGDYEAVEAIIEFIISLDKEALVSQINLCDEDGNTALHLAVATNNKKITKLLLKYKNSPNDIVDIATSLLATAQSKDSKMVKLLIEHMNTITPHTNAIVQKILQANFKSDSSSAFLEDDWLLNVLESLGNTYIKLILPLELSVQEGDTNKANELLSELLKLYAQNDTNKLPLKMAIEHKHVGAVQLLLAQGAEYGYRDTKEALKLAVQEDNLVISKVLLAGKYNEILIKEYANELIPISIQQKNIEITRLLFEAAEELNIPLDIKGFLQLLEPDDPTFLQQVITIEPLTKIIAQEELWLTTFFSSEYKNGSFSGLAQGIYDKLTSYGYKFIGLNKPLLDASSSDDSLIGKVLKNIYTDIEDSSLNNLLMSLLREGLEIVTKHPHIGYIFETANIENIKAFLYKEFQPEAGGWYESISKTVSIFKGYTNIEDLKKLYKLSPNNDSSLREYLDAKCKYLANIMEILTHEYTHAAMNIAFNNNCEAFARGDKASEQAINDLLYKYKITEHGVFKSINTPLYADSSTKPPEIPAYLYQGLARELIRKEFVGKVSLTLPSDFYETIEKCKPLVEYFTKLLGEKTNGAAALPYLLYQPDSMESTEVTTLGEIDTPAVTLHL